MAHNIETFTDGTAAFVSARQDAWHRLGTVTTEAFTAQDAMELARLGGWNVRTAPLIAQVPGEDGTTIPQPVEGAYATVRDNPITRAPEALGTVGPGYTPVQNEAHCDLLNALVGESGAHFETAGSLHGGRQVFVTLKLPRTMTFSGRDSIDLYIAALNSHDGSSAFRLIVTPVRIVCANTQAAALARARGTFSIRHTSGAQGRILEARNALQLTWQYADAFEEEAERMIATELEREEFAQIVEGVFPAPQGPGVTAQKRRTHQRKVSALNDLFTNSPTLEGVRGTRWAGYQAVTEYLDHFAPVRGGASRGEGFASEARAVRTATSSAITAQKNAAWHAFA
jgi:phage/plasmid-like protein (TIGR03299 family)